MHGGVHATAVESAASLAVPRFAAERGMVAVDVNTNTNFAMPLTAGRVEVTARPLQQGRTQPVRQVDFVGQARRLIATGRLRLASADPPASGPVNDEVVA